MAADAAVEAILARFRAAFRRETWCLDAVEFADGGLRLSGWALPVKGESGRGVLSIDGMVSTDGAYGLPRPDIADIYPYVPASAQSGFTVKSRPAGKQDHVRIAYVDKKTGREVYEHHAFFVPTFLEEAPFPDFERRKRTTGPTTEASFGFTGYTIAMKLDAVLRQKCRRGLADFPQILDWGGGCGRVTRYIDRLAKNGRQRFFAKKPSVVTLVDIDQDNVSWVRDHLQAVRAEAIPLVPPTSFGSGQFDLVFGNSVFTHLQEEIQFKWLEELRRITRRGGVVAVTVHNFKDLLKATKDQWEIQKFFANGFIDEFQDSALSGHVEDGYYRAAFHTHEYIKENWKRYFRKIEIVEEFSNNHQDLVLLS